MTAKFLMSSHARTRLAQRNIPALMLWLVDEYGETIQQDGATVKVLKSRGKEKARSIVKVILERWDTLQDTYFVESRGDSACVVTAGIRHERIRGR